MPTKILNSDDQIAGFAASDLTAFLAKLSLRDRTSLERTLALPPQERPPASFGSDLWSRLAAGLMAMGEHQVKLSGKDGVQFLAPDGKYFVQVFALQNRADGGFEIYAKDILEDPAALKIVRAPADGEHLGAFTLREGKGAVTATRLSADVPEHPATYRNLMSWNRRAIQIRIPADVSDAELSAVGKLCRISVAPASKS